MQKKFFDFDSLDKNNFTYDQENENPFLSIVEQTIRIMQLDHDDPYTDLMLENIRSMCSEIEFNLDEFLQSLNVSFRVDQFLLLLFNELYEYFILGNKSIGNFV